MNNYEKEITELKKKIAEYEAVEQYIMETIRNGGEYDDILKAHYREGKVVDGEWVDDKEEEEEEEEDINDCGVCGVVKSSELCRKCFDEVYKNMFKDDKEGITLENRLTQMIKSHEEK